WVPKLLERWRTSMIGSDMAGALLHVKILGLMVRVRGVVHPAGVGQGVGGVQVVVLGAVQLFLPQAQQIAGHQGHGQIDQHDDGGALKIGILGAHHALVDKEDRKSTRLNSSHVSISYAVFCLKKKKKRLID